MKTLFSQNTVFLVLSFIISLFSYTALAKDVIYSKKVTIRSSFFSAKTLLLAEGIAGEKFSLRIEAPLEVDLSCYGAKEETPLKFLLEKENDKVLCHYKTKKESFSLELNYSFIASNISGNFFDPMYEEIVPLNENDLRIQKPLLEQIERIKSRFERQTTSSDYLKALDLSDTYNTFTKITYPHPEYGEGFNYDVFYYVPSTLKNKKNRKALFFLHGGGSSTMTEAGSERVVRMYSPFFMDLAKRLGFVLVMPSGSGHNWGSHTKGYLEHLAAFMTKKLDLNSNKIGLAGHSMGGMGITRSFQWLTDTFAFFMPMAAGMQAFMLQEKYLSALFNTTYTHLQGLKDHFTEFVTRCQDQEHFMELLEEKYNKESGLSIIYYDGPHNYDRALVERELKKHFKDQTRNMSQKELHGVFFSRYQDLVYNDRNYTLYSTYSYFWLEALAFKMPPADRPVSVISFNTTIDENTIYIRLIDKKEDLSKLRVYLNNSLVNLKHEVKIFINNELAFLGKVPLKSDEMKQIKESKGDPNFDYLTYVDLNL